MGGLSYKNMLIYRIKNFQSHISFWLQLRCIMMKIIIGFVVNYPQTNDFNYLKKKKSGIRWCFQVKKKVKKHYDLTQLSNDTSCGASLHPVLLLS